MTLRLVPPLDLTCRSDNDCCVAVDTCRALAVLYSKIGSPLVMPPVEHSYCADCYTPIVEVSCVNKRCVGSQQNTPMNGYDHCGKLGIGGSGGRSLQSIESSTAGATSAATTAATTPPPQTRFSCGG